MAETEGSTGARRRRSRSEAEQLVRDFEASGLTRRQFCERSDVAPNTFHRYVQRYGAKPTARREAQRLVAVEVVNADPLQADIVVVLPRGLRVEVATGFDPGTLQRVVAALET